MQKKKILLHVVTCTLILLVVLVVFVLLDYIDFSVIQAIYLPIWVIGMAGVLLRQYLFSYIFISAAGLGLIVEYLIHLSQTSPSMQGAFVNTLIIILGFIIGAVAQIILKFTPKTPN
ncbi:MAG: hypothetical protein IBX69_14505 [Anaerolineales bacterium]|nr:hypothetical protein [Anaerolineales bacterium]